MARTAEASLTSNWHNYLKGGLLLNYYYGLVAFLIPLGIRAIPELLAGQYPIGFDTGLGHIFCIARGEFIVQGCYDKARS